MAAPRRLSSENTAQPGTVPPQLIRKPRSKRTSEWPWKPTNAPSGAVQTAPTRSLAPGATCSPSSLAAASSLPGGERELMADEVLDPFFARQREPGGVSLRAHLDGELEERAAPALQRHPLREEREAHALQLDSKRQAAVAFARLRNGGPQGLRELAVTLALIGGKRQGVAEEAPLRGSGG